MIRRFFIAILFLVAVTFPAWAEVYEVIIDDTGFHPEKIEILSGDTIKWVNKGTTVHSATEERAAFDSGPLSPGLSYEHTFNGFNMLTHLTWEISYVDMKDGFGGKIVFDNSTLEISPGDSTFLSDRKITMTIFYPSVFWNCPTTCPTGLIKIFYDGTLIFEGTHSQLANVLPVESSGTVVDPYKGPETLIYYTSFSLPPFSLPPGIHQITMEFEYERKKFRDSVTYTVFQRKSVDVPY